MNCVGWREVLCSLEEIARNTGPNEPSAFDAWASIVLPAIAAAASVAVALAALLVARQSHNFAVESREKDEQARHREERSRLAAMARSRGMSSYARSGGLAMTDGVEMALLGYHLREEAAASDELFAAEMHTDYAWLETQFLVPTTPGADRVGSVVLSAILSSVRQWVRDPQTWHDSSDVRRTAAVLAINAARAEQGHGPLG